MDVYWRYEVWARKQYSRIDSLFNATGCVYAMRRALAAPLPPDTPLDDAVLPLRAFLRGYRVILHPEAIAIAYPALTGTQFLPRFRPVVRFLQLLPPFPPT